VGFSCGELAEPTRGEFVEPAHAVSLHFIILALIRVYQRLNIFLYD